MSRQTALLEYLRVVLNSQKVDENSLLLEIDPDFFSCYTSRYSAQEKIRDWFRENLMWNLSLPLQNTLELILVMAVQSRKNEHFIEKMQLLDIHTQLELKNIIQETFEEGESLFSTKDSKKEEITKNEREIRDLRSDLESCQVKLDEKVEEISSLKKKIKELSKNETRGLEEELQFLKEKLQKMEVLLEKYKKKLQAGNSVKELQELLSQKNKEISELKEESRRNVLQKDILEKYKSKLTKLEKNSLEKEEEIHILEKECQTLQNQFDLYQKEKGEEIKILNERIIEISNIKVKEEENTNTLGEVEKIQELAGQVQELTMEIQRTKDLLLLEENKLDDMTRLKNAFEEDYRKTLQENSRVQKENLQLLTEFDKKKDQDSLQKILNQTLESFQELKIVKDEQDHKLETLSEQVKAAQEECRLKHGQVNSLIQEKESLQTKLENLREKAHATDQQLAETRASLTAQESRNEVNDVNTKLASATQKIVQLTDQNALLHQALRKAKNHILILDKTIKDEKSLRANHSDQNPYAEAIHSFETQLAEKTAEINRLKADLKDLKESTKREEELMSTAWYNLCSTLHPSEVDKLAGGTPWLELEKTDLL